MKERAIQAENRIQTEAQDRTKEEELLDMFVHYSTNCDEQPELLARCASRIKDFYANEYRHRYSNISKYIHSGQQQEQETGSYTLDGCQKLREDLRKQNPFESDEALQFYIKRLDKISDHIELEIIRSGVAATQNSFFQERLETRAAALSGQIEQTNNSLKSSIKKLDGIELNFVSVLGIFSGVVMAFAGLFSVSSGILGNLNGTPLSKLLVVLVILGWILSNAIIALMHSVATILNRDTRTVCYKGGNLSCINCKHNCKLKFVRHNINFIKVNVAFALVAVVCIVARVIIVLCF